MNRFHIFRVLGWYLHAQFVGPRDHRPRTHIGVEDLSHSLFHECMIIYLFGSEDHYVRLIALSLPVPTILAWFCTLCFPPHQIIGCSCGAHADQCLRPSYHAHIHRAGMRGLFSTVLVQVLG